MKRSYEQVNEGGNENNREDEPANREQWIKDISSHLEEDRARNQEHKGSMEDTEEKPSMMNEDQIAMIYNLCRDRVPFQHIENIMGVPEHKVDFPEFERVMVEASILIRKEEKWAGRSMSENLPRRGQDSKADQEKIPVSPKPEPVQRSSRTTTQYNGRWQLRGPGEILPYTMRKINPDGSKLRTHLKPVPRPQRRSLSARSGTAGWEISRIFVKEIFCGSLTKRDEAA